MFTWHTASPSGGVHDFPLDSTRQVQPFASLVPLIDVHTFGFQFPLIGIEVFFLGAGDIWHA